MKEIKQLHDSDGCANFSCPACGCIVAVQLSTHSPACAIDRARDVACFCELPEGVSVIAPPPLAPITPPREPPPLAPITPPLDADAFRPFRPIVSSRRRVP